MHEPAERAIADLLRAAEDAHGAYETEVLGGAFDEEWPAWYATYLLEHGLAELLGEVTDEELAATLKQLAADYERDKPDEPWPDVYAQRLAPGSG